MQCLVTFVDDGQRLRNLNSFNALAAVLAGLTTGPVHRLEHTHAGLPQESRQVLQDLIILMSPEAAHRNYREAQKMAEPPSIPYLYVTVYSRVSGMPGRASN